MLAILLKLQIASDYDIIFLKEIFNIDKKYLLLIMEYINSLKVKRICHWIFKTKNSQEEN